MSPKLFNTLLITFSFVLYSYVVIPLYDGSDGVFWTPENNVKELLSSKNRYDVTVEKFPVFLKQASSVLEQYTNLSEDMKKNIFIMVPLHIEDVVLLNELTETANKKSVIIEDLSVKDRGSEVSINFSVKTTYSKFKSLMDSYEKSLRLLTVRSIAFNPSKDEAELVKFNVELSTYYLK